MYNTRLRDSVLYFSWLFRARSNKVLSQWPHRFTFKSTRKARVLKMRLYNKFSGLYDSDIITHLN